MTNRNYKNGADKERRIVLKLKAKGFISARSAGSHSPIDVWSINPETHEVILIQAKGRKERSVKKLEKELKELDGLYYVRTAVMTSSGDVDDY